MITDYSSVAIDFAYMKKPTLYYQFDEEKFRRGQYAQDTLITAMGLVPYVPNRRSW